MRKVAHQASLLVERHHEELVFQVRAFEEATQRRTCRADTAVCLHATADVQDYPHADRGRLLSKSGNSLLYLVLIDLEKSRSRPVTHLCRGSVTLTLKKTVSTSTLKSGLISCFLICCAMAIAINPDRAATEARIPRPYRFIELPHWTLTAHCASVLYLSEIWFPVSSHVFPESKGETHGGCASSEV